MKYIKLKKTQIKKIALGLVLIMGATQLQTASASTMSNAKDKKAAAQNELGSVNNKIGKIEDEQAVLRKQINALDEDLVEIIISLNILEGDLAAKDEQLIQVQVELEQARKDEETQYEAMKKRIRFMYERGDATFITSILESESITDLLNRVEYVNDVYDYDRELLVAYQTTKLQVAQLEQEVKDEITELEELQANYEQEQQEFETLKAEKQGQVADFDTKLASAKSLAAEYQATIEEQNSIIRQEEDRIAREAAEAAAQAAAAQQQASAGGGGTGSPDASGGGGGDGNQNPDYSTGVSGSAIVGYAQGFVGNPYVWGGTDPNTGADCSGFIMYVFAQYGISLPRTSVGQRSAGQEVSYSNAQPGDLICYSGHVAIYAGGGQIVHASNSAPYPAGGIKMGTATYRSILSVRRVL